MTKNSSVPVRENKAFSLQIKEFDDAQGRIKGYLSTFDNIDEGRDRVRPGAFKRTLANKYAYKQNHNKRYVMPFLWQHDTNEPIGGFLELKEDTVGLFFDLEIDLEIQRGRECYSGYKKGYIYQTSMGYDCIQSEYVKVDGDMVRDLLEVRLWEGSAVTFPMNEQAVVTSVKSLEQKSICGDTSGPIGPRDENWDGAAAKKWIWSKSLDADDNVKPATAKKYFMRVDGDPSLQGSYSYPFWIDDHISVGGVKACANALAGARNADVGGDEAGMRKKVETLYKRISAKYPDDPELVPPWKDEGKSMSERQKKTLMEHYNEEMAEDLLEDWQDVYLCSLTCAILDAFTIGDQPAQDITDALDAFKELVLSKFVAQAQEVGLSEYIANHTCSSSPAEYLMQYGNDSKPDYGYMSRRSALARKSGRAISAANQSVIDEHVAGLHEKADDALGMLKKAMQHMKSIHTAADDFANTIQGSETPYTGDDPGKPDQGQQEGKTLTTRNGRTVTLQKAANGTPIWTTDGVLGEDEQHELQAALAALKALRK